MSLINDLENNKDGIKSALELLRVEQNSDTREKMISYLVNQYLPLFVQSSEGIIAVLRGIQTQIQKL